MLKPFVRFPRFLGKTLEGSMRRRLGLLTVILAATLAVPAGAQEKPRYGGELIFAVPSEPPSYDAHREETFGVIHPLAPHYNTLLRPDPADKTATRIVGDLAESWTISKDGRTYTLKLRRGVKFHDGSEMTSKDVKASYDKIIFPPPGVASDRKGEYLDVELDLQGRHPVQGHAVVRDERDGHGPVRLRGAREGLALGGQEEPELLGQGQALPRRLPGDLHQGLGGPGVGRPRRARAHPVPRLLTGRARQPRRRPRLQDRRAGEPVGLRAPGRDEPREETVRRQAGAPRPHARARPLPGLAGAVEDRHREGSGGRPGAGDAVRNPAGRAGEARRLLA